MQLMGPGKENVAVDDCSRIAEERGEDADGGRLHSVEIGLIKE